MNGFDLEKHSVRDLNAAAAFNVVAAAMKQLPLTGASWTAGRRGDY